MKINTNKLVYKLFASMLILVLFTTWLMSGLLAKYTSGNAVSDESEVALWEIDAIGENGKEITTGVNLKKNIAGGANDSWYFGIRNESDVAAMLESTSTVRIEILSGPLDTIGKNKIWAFLGDKNASSDDNPIKLSVSLINDDINNVLEYKNVNTNAVISYDEYYSLSDAEKTNYTRVEKSVSTNLVFQSSDSMKLTKALNSDNKTYFYAEFDFSKISESLLDFGVKGQDGFKNKTIKLSWTISDNSTGSGSGGSESTFYNYSITNVEPSDSEIVAGPFENITYTNNNGEKVTETLYVKKTGLIFSDYFLFSGGEPMFTFGNMKKPFSILTNEEIAEIKTRASKVLPESTTYDAIKEYTEALAYDQYAGFMSQYSDFAAAQGYVQCGLTLSVVFNVKIVQKD